MRAERAHLEPVPVSAVPPHPMQLWARALSSVGLGFPQRAPGGGSCSPSPAASLAPASFSLDCASWCGQGRYCAPSIPLSSLPPPPPPPQGALPGAAPSWDELNRQTRGLWPVLYGLLDRGHGGLRELGKGHLLISLDQGLRQGAQMQPGLLGELGNLWVLCYPVAQKGSGPVETPFFQAA